MTDMTLRKAGDRIPAATFKIREGGSWLERTTDQIFAGRSVVVFALPGAFTPTCSSTHLPGYVTLASKLKAAGVDEICCLSVNDSFVMNAWAKDQGVDREVTMLPDGNADFTAGMGMLVSKRELGFGKRSWRYSMLVRDGVIERIFVEDLNDKGDPFAVSDASTMLRYLTESRAAAE